MMRKIATALLLLCIMALCLTGCHKKDEPVVQNNDLADYLANVESQSNTIRNSLEKDVLTQNEMNQKACELCALWEAAMNRILEEARKTLPAAEVDKLTAEQDAWLQSRAKAVEAAGKEVEGGSMHALVVSSESAKFTEARVYELYSLLE